MKDISKTYKIGQWQIKVSYLSCNETVYVKPVGKSFAAGYRYPEDLKELEGIVGEEVFNDFISMLNEQ